MRTEEQKQRARELAQKRWKERTPDQRKRDSENSKKWRSENREYVREVSNNYYHRVAKERDWRKKAQKLGDMRALERYRTDPEFRAKKNQQALDWRRNNWQISRLRSAAGRAKRIGREFSITVADVVWNESCPILGIPLNYSNEKQLDDSPSLDRIDNNKGYVPGNVVVVSWKANNLKSNGTLEDFKKLIVWLEQQGSNGTH